MDNCEIVHGLLERRLGSDELAVPLLPEVAVRVVRAGPKGSTNARQLAEIINADPALTMFVLRVARSAAKQPALPIGTLPHAVAWLGFDEVANIAFTLALQCKLLDVKGQQHKARRLWRHSLASALWSRQLAHMLAEETGMCYLCGLLHNIGKVVTLGAVHEVAQRAGKKLTGQDYDRLIETFHRHIGARVIGAWALPSPVPTVISQWEAYSAAGPVRFECNVVNVAHALADFTLLESTQSARDLLVRTAAYRALGLTSADSEPLFDSAASINAELDRYLAP
ncbi:MAG TPA: HDOD domain-containing protein [Steroidobacteraceae bacterium]|jgi:HD-like signal output (HDOD) protein|nr:HDOD domain-containing protein [Steroidobacteraceae bacterium]